MIITIIIDTEESTEILTFEGNEIPKELEEFIKKTT